jgi:hypothetical protein
MEKYAGDRKDDMKRPILVLLCLTIIQSIISTAGERIPPVLREMRATWVATVANIDWPSSPGLLAPKDSMLKILKEGAFAAQALVPASPWLDRTAPNSPELRCGKKAGELLLSWKAIGREKPSLYILSINSGGNWSNEILPAAILHAAKKFNGANIAAVAISAVDRCGNESKKKIIAIQPDSAAASK